MKFTTLTNYTSNEIEKNEELKKLFIEWDINLLEKYFWNIYDRDYFVTDGIFPGYSLQNKKILFIGKEVLDIAGQNYIDIFYNGICKKIIGGKNINSHLLYKRMLKITHGLIYNCMPWEVIPEASYIADDFGKNTGISFAFINISKLSHEYQDKDTWKADSATIMKFIETSYTFINSFLTREIEIIDPDIIISMNIGMYYKYFEEVSFNYSIRNVDIYNMKLKNSNIPILDTWHFAALKSDNLAFYQPICEVIEGLK